MDCMYKEGFVMNNILTEIGVSKEEISDNKERNIDLNHKVKFLVAGRMIYRKGHDFLFDALMILPDNVDYECRIVGSGEEYEKLKEKCNKSVLLSKHITFTGNIKYEQMIQEYKRADILIMPSLRETTGTVVMEAMSNGLPVITINRFGAVNIVDEDTGWLYDGSTEEDFVKSLANIILDCINNPKEIESKKKNVIEKIKKFTWDRKIKLYQDIYLKLLNI